MGSPETERRDARGLTRLRPCKKCPECESVPPGAVCPRCSGVGSCGPPWICYADRKWLMTENEKAVWWHARLHAQDLDENDLEDVAAAIRVLMWRATASYDPALGNSFTTYYWRYVKHTAHLERYNILSRGVRLPSTVSRRKDSPAKGVVVSTYPFGLGALRDKGYWDWTYEEPTVHDEPEANPAAGVDRAIDAAMAVEGPNRVTSREARVLRFLYVMRRPDGRPNTLQTCCEELNVSRERVRQIRNKAVFKLKRLAGAGVIDYDDSPPGE